MALRLGCDIDGVLADFRTAFQGAARSGAVESPTSPSFDDEPLTSRDLRRVWAAVRRTPNWWTTLEAFEPAQIARFYALARRLRWEVVFMTRRPESAGDPVQFQTQWWLEQHGFYLPAVVTVPGSRGDLANALRLDMILDDQIHNCMDVVGASPARAIFVLRDPQQTVLRQHATDRGIGVVSSFEEALDVLERAQEVLTERRGRLHRLVDWFRLPRDESLPLKPDVPRPGPSAE